MLIDICFLMDCTGSMEPWIQAAKDQVRQIVDKTQQETTDAEVRVAFVGYRDYGDLQQFVVYDFLDDVDVMLDKIRAVHASGGDDIAEDVAGGLFHASQLQWKGDVKTIFHIADAPAHGGVFHEPYVSDRFPNQDPCGYDLLQMSKMLTERNIDYTFIKINDSTNIMIHKLHGVYTGPGEFRVMDLRPQAVRDTDVTTRLLPSIMTSINASIVRYTSSQDPSVE